MQKTSRLPITDGELIYIPGFLPPAQADTLFQQLYEGIEWRQDQIRLFGKQHAIPRLQAFQGEPGLHYRYSNLTLQSAPWHPAIAALLPTLNTYHPAGFNCTLLNLYRDGQDAMGWHSDDEPELGPDPIIASLSLGEARRFLLRHRTNKLLDKVELKLGHGDLLIMAGSTQHHWHHSVPRSKPIQSPRINLTFRHILR